MNLKLILRTQMNQMIAIMKLKKALCNIKKSRSKNKIIIETQMMIFQIVRLIKSLLNKDLDNSMTKLMK